MCKRSKTVKCSICKEFGHNAATCKGGLTAKEKGKKKQSKKKGVVTYEQPEIPEHVASTSKPASGKQKNNTSKVATQQPSTSTMKPPKNKKKGTLTQPF